MADARASPVKAWVGVAEGCAGDCTGVAGLAGVADGYCTSAIPATRAATTASAAKPALYHRFLDHRACATWSPYPVRGAPSTLIAQERRPEEPAVTDPVFRILTVCTGNICRSPVAEKLLQAGLGDAVAVGSAGVRALVGEPIHPGMMAHLRQGGVLGDGFAARQIAPADVRAADLVLALTRAHRTHVVQQAPAALRRSFTLLEFARIVASPDLPAVPADAVGVRLRALVPLAARHRAPSPTADADDVPDPYGGGSADYERAYALIRDAVELIVRAVRG